MEDINKKYVTLTSYGRIGLLRTSKIKGVVGIENDCKYVIIEENNDLFVVCRPPVTTHELCLTDNPKLCIVQGFNTSLRTLTILRCPQLPLLPQLPTALTKLTLGYNGFSVPEILPPYLVSLTCYGSFPTISCSNITKLKCHAVHNVTRIETLPECLRFFTFTNSSSLEYINKLPINLLKLKLRGCSNLRYLPLIVSETLTKCDLSGCNSLEGIPMRCYNAHTFVPKHLESNISVPAVKIYPILPLVDLVLTYVISNSIDISGVPSEILDRQKTWERCERCASHAVKGKTVYIGHTDLYVYRSVYCQYCEPNLSCSSCSSCSSTDASSEDDI